MIEHLLADDTTDNNTVGGLVVLILFGAILYIVPSVIALARRVRNRGAVIVINLLLGWTFIGWVVALAMAFSTVDRKPQQPVMPIAQWPPQQPPLPPGYR